MKYRAPAVDAAFGIHLAWPKVARLGDLDFLKVRVNALAARYVNVGAKVEAKAIGDIDCDIADGGIEARIPESHPAVGQHSDYRTAPGFSTNRAADGADADAPAAGLNPGRSKDLGQVNAATAGFGLDLTGALIDANPAPASLEFHHLAVPD